MGALRGRRILLTGGAGFLGRHVHDALLPYEPAAIFVPRSADFDLRRRDSIQRLLRLAQPQVVIHLAAVVGGIGANQQHPGQFFYDNAIMGIELMEQARQFEVEKFVATGSICAYPKHTPIPFREEDLWEGYPEETNAPYGLAKKMLLVQAQAYRQEYDFSAITLFPVNLYGPGDNFDLESSHVIPALIRKMVAAREESLEEVEVWGTGSASREFLYVKDAARGIAAAADLYNKPEPVNLGSGQEITICRLAQTIADLCGYHGPLRWDASRPDGQPRRCLDVTRARREFNFQAATSLHAGLHETIHWYQTQHSAALVGHAA
ncbi:MAG TPA: GDP-L-fucose synthase [Pirellulales bacterium]|jgi:GDP-L-fucose synthase|nr:GDP-L-fucose synthase [Pirellulales bacterium]